jgi:3-hydroxyisobutyrate dehydrogenase-like beta-hydroxyacid dehydrogenase
VNNAQKPRIAILGTGRMGSALARAFLKQGYATSVWNRTKSKCEPLGQLGAQIAPSVLDAIAAAEVIIVNVKDYVTSDRLLCPDDVTKALRGKLVVQLASGSPKLARETANWARRHDISYLDGAIMATPNLIGAPECTILYSGPVELFEKYKPILLALGGNAIHVGSDVGHASALDSALLVVMWGALFGAVHGAAICQAEKLPLDAYLGYLKPLLPQVDEWVTETVQRIADDRLASDEATLASVDVHYVALQALLELCRERGIYRAVPDAFGQLFQAAVNAGHAQDDFAILSKFMREQSPEDSAKVSIA